MIWLQSRFSAVSLQLGCCKASHRLATPVSVIERLRRFSVVSLQLGCCKALHRLGTTKSVIELPSRFSVVSLQPGCWNASHRLATPISLIRLFCRCNVVSLQLGCCKALHRLTKPVLVIKWLTRPSEVSLQLGSCKAWHRLATPVSVILVLPPRFSVVSLQLGCCKASHRLATLISVIPLYSTLSLVNFPTTNLLITSTCSRVNLIRNKFSSDTRQCSSFSELQIRCIPGSVSCDSLSSNFWTVTNLSEHLCCASPASSLFSSLIMSNTNDTPMLSTSDKFLKAMTPSELQNAWGFFLINFFANSLSRYSFRHVIWRLGRIKGESNSFSISSLFPSLDNTPAMNWKTMSEYFLSGTQFSFTNQRAAKNSWMVRCVKLKCFAVVIGAVLKGWPQ